MIFAIGDIHGQSKRLRNLLDLLANAGMADADTLVFIGDYVDRGPDTCGVLNTLIDLKAIRPNTVFLRGNHEQMLLDARQRFDPSFESDNPAGNVESGLHWFSEGGVESLQSYGEARGRKWVDLIPGDHWRFMKSCVLEYTEGTYLFVHAGIVPPGEEWYFPPFDADPRLWIREQFHISQSDFGGKTIVFGHTPTADGKPAMSWNKIGIDTGAGYGGPLTAVGLPDFYRERDVTVFQS